MVSIESVGWYIFLIITAAVILFFNWLFLRETKRIQEKMKGMKSFSDIIDATNQALDEFNVAFEEAGNLLENKRNELGKLIEKADAVFEKLESSKSEIELISSDEIEPALDFGDTSKPGDTFPELGEGERVELIRQFLAEGKTAEEISRITGASIREVQLVGKFSN